MKTFAIASLLSVGAILFFGCNKADNAVDCQSICERYKDCYDKNYDVGACRDKCMDEADTEGYATKADSCDSCLDDNASCASQTFGCATKCAGIVP